MNSSAPLQSSSTSFAPGLRYPAPDVARGLMLLLIAVANVPVWLLIFPGDPQMSVADQSWVLIRGLLIDHRIYPLFATLFGFGLATMVARRQQAHVAKRTAELDERMPGMPDQLRAQWLATFEDEARVESRRLLRRRGWWMLLFGMVHFFGDIIGAYALMAVLFAGVIASGRKVPMIVWSCVFLLIVLLLGLSQGWAMQQGFAGTNINTMNYEYFLGWWYPISGLITWAIGSVMTLVGAMVVPSMFFGVWLAQTDYLTRPDLHRAFLAVVSILGLCGGALTALLHSLKRAAFAESEPFYAYVLQEIGGFLGAVGWLALLALMAGPAREQLSTWQKVLSAVGRRSMTAYISQSVLFATIFLVLGFVGAQQPSQVMAAGIAVLVWLITVVMCVAMDHAGKMRGPLEVLLRRAVARSAKPRKLQEIPFAPAA